MDPIRNVPLLTLSNYGTWSRELKVLLMDRGCWSFIDNTEEPLDAEATRRERNDFHFRKDKAFSTIYFSISDEFKPLLTSTTDGSEAWKLLKQHFEPQSRARLMQLLDIFFGTKMQSDETVGLFLSRVKKAVQDLADADHPVPEIYQAFQAIRYLPENRPVPEPASNEVLIAIHTVGICGSDVHYWKSGRIGDFVVQNEMVLGHETSGTVIKVGEAVTHLKEGDRVCIEPGVPCRICEFCKKGRYNLCADVVFCATPPHDGSLQQYYTHAADFCYKLPDHVSLEEGALMEPLSVAVHACRRASVTAGSYVLICGAGPIGLANLLVAKAMGASKICITDISPTRLEMAKKLGATHQVNVKDRKLEDIAEEIATSLGSRPNITIECSGAEFSVKLGIRATKSGGTIVLIGHGAAEITIPIVDAGVREIDIRGVFRYANCYPISLDLVSSGAVDVKPMITHRFNLKETLKAFETAHTGAGGAIKVLINCENVEN